MPKLEPVTFPSAGSHPEQIEGVLHTVDGKGQWPAAVICHPHPLGGGTMHNRVVSSIARVLSASGVICLRFNFRGTGRSSGVHDFGRGEQADVAGALDWLLARSEVDPWRVSVVGYSFGAWVGLVHAEKDPRVATAVAAGLAAWHYNAEFARTHALAQLGTDRWVFDPEFLQTYTRPKLLIAAEQDAFAPLEMVQELVERLPLPKFFHLMRGCDHSFYGQELEVGERVAEFLASV